MLLMLSRPAQDVLSAIQDAPYSTSPKKAAANAKAATRDQVGAHLNWIWGALAMLLLGGAHKALGNTTCCDEKQLNVAAMRPAGHCQVRCAGGNRVHGH